MNGLVYCLPCSSKGSRPSSTMCGVVADGLSQWMGAGTAHHAAGCHWPKALLLLLGLLCAMAARRCDIAPSDL